MRVTDQRRGYGHKTVTIEGIAPDRQVSDDLLIGFAMHAAGENPSRLFGWSVSTYNDRTKAIVTLNTE